MKDLRRAGAVAVALVALAVAATTPARAAVPSPTCSWAGETDQRDVNIGAPDDDAYYWLSPLAPAPGTEERIAGSYPHARYFSFHLYNDSGEAIDSIYDREIAPSAGSANPFAGKVRRGAGDSYAVTVRFEPAPAEPAADTLYAGEASGPLLLVYRVYVPADTSEPQGSVPYPQLSVANAEGAPILTDGACSTTPPAFGSALWQTFAEGSYPEGLPVAPLAEAAPTPQWQRAFGSRLGNQQNAYLESVVSHAYGQLVVIHTRAPSFPNTGAGQPPYKRADLRYWSFCSYDADGEALVGCAADHDAAVEHHSVTYVVSDAAHRPRDATAADGVTWLPWGAQGEAQIVYRNMLPAPGFRYAAESITSPSQSPQLVMGAYYPSSAYCSVATFEAGGWKACFRGSG